MSLARENKALNAKHAQILRELVKQPDNKLCADCKKNDARWASVNLGVFMCIRCSGIHRSLGVHITRIKSIDLDTWAPAQISNVQRWGNKRANKYWEAHLKPGHIPPDHKMDSFIRSKYESKRWAMEGPVPEPETLDDGSSVSVSAPAAETKPSSRAAVISDEIDFLSGPVAPAPSAPVSRAVNASAPPPSAAKSPVPQSSAPQKASNGGGGGGLFDLDFSSSPAMAATTLSRPSSSKADILSLFSKPAPNRPPAYNNAAQPTAAPTQTQTVTDAFEGLSFESAAVPPMQQQPAPQRQPSAYAPQPANPWAAPPPTQPQTATATSHRPTDSFGQMSSTSSTSQQSLPVRSAPQSNNFSGLFDSADVWGASASTATAGASAQSVHSSQPTSSAFEFGDFSSSSAAPSSGNSAFTSSGNKVPAFDDFGDIWK